MWKESSSEPLTHVTGDWSAAGNRSVGGVPGLDETDVSLMLPAGATRYGTTNSLGTLTTAVPATPVDSHALGDSVSTMTASGGNIRPGANPATPSCGLLCSAGLNLGRITGMVNAPPFR